MCKYSVFFSGGLSGIFLEEHRVSYNKARLEQSRVMSEKMTRRYCRLNQYR